MQLQISLVFSKESRLDAQCLIRLETVSKTPSAWTSIEVSLNILGLCHSRGNAGALRLKTELFCPASRRELSYEDDMPHLSPS